MKSNWKKLNRVSFSKLSETRKQLHQAIQLVAIPARAFLPDVKDDHFASLRWNEDLNVIISQTWGKDYKTALNFNDFILVLIDGQNTIVDSFSLNGKTYKECFEKLNEMVLIAEENPKLLTTNLPYEIPQYPTASIEKFTVFDKSFFEETAKYFSNANLVLEKVVKNNPEASEIACWPHHFDLASLLVLDGSSENYKSVGVGLSPGDDNYDQPYFYITPWPYPNTEKVTLPDLPSGGFWHTKGWIGAVLTFENILKQDNSESQKKSVTDFLNVGIKVAKKFF